MDYMKRRGIRYLLLTLGVDAAFFGFTDPSQVSPIWLIVAYILAIGTLYWVFRGVVAFASLYIRSIKRNRQRLVRTMTVVAAILLGLESMGQLSARDVLVLLPLALTAYFYTTYIVSQKGKA